MAWSNIVQAMYADIAAPADAIDEPSDWEHYDGGCYSRMYSAAKLCVRASSVVNIFGWQFTDGRPTERDIMVDVTDETMTAAEARLLAAALIEAADVLDRLTGATPPLSTSYLLFGPPSCLGGGPIQTRHRCSFAASFLYDSGTFHAHAPHRAAPSVRPTVMTEMRRIAPRKHRETPDIFRGLQS